MQLNKTLIAYNLNHTHSKLHAKETVPCEGNLV